MWKFHPQNAETTADRYPMPHMQYFAANLADAKVFSKIDLAHSYHQIPVHPSEIPKMAIITPFGLWEFLHKQFGLKNEAQSFQQLMDTVLKDLDFTLVYINDILVASYSKTEQGTHLQQVFQCLQQHGLVLNLANCQFVQQEIDFWDITS